MKKILAVVLIVGLVICLSAVAALADDPPIVIDVSGTIQNDAGVIFGTLVVAPADSGNTMILSGSVTEYVDHRAAFTGTVSGYMEGSITAVINDNGVDTIAGEITGTGIHFWITGVFPKPGVEGQFIGKISSVPANPTVENMTLGTATGATSVEVGKTLQMTVSVEPDGASDDVAWSVWTADGSEAATIDTDTGLLTGKQAGTVTVIAKALDGSLKDATMSVTMVDTVLEELSVDPTYTIVIPGIVDFGTLQKNTGVKTQPFNITAWDVEIGDDGEIQVCVSSSFKMLFKDQYLKYSLYNHEKTVGDAGLFAIFTDDGEEDGYVGINTDDITHSGSYTGIMTFKITYEE